MTRFEPKDPNFRQKVKNSFARQQVMKTLEVRLTDLGPGTIELRFPYRQAWSQQHGFLHAGVVATVLDSACGYAAFSLMPAEAGILAVEFKINLLSPAVGDSFRVAARVVKPGRTISVCRGDAFARSGDREKTIAQMTGTMMAVYDREGVEQ